MSLHIFLSADWSREATRLGVPAATQVPETTAPPYCMEGQVGNPKVWGCRARIGEGRKTNKRWCDSESAPASQGREQLHTGRSVEAARHHCSGDRGPPLQWEQESAIYLSAASIGSHCQSSPHGALTSRVCVCVTQPLWAATKTESLESGLCRAGC